MSKGNGGSMPLDIKPGAATKFTPGTPQQVVSRGGFSDAPTEPELALLYGPSGAGKTFAMLRAAPNFLWLAAPGALKPIAKALAG